MDTESWYQEKLASVKNDFNFKFDSLVLDITETIQLKLKEKNISFSKLANRLGVTPAAVSKLLRGESNFTIRKLMEIADAIDLSIDINFVSQRAEGEEYTPVVQEQLFPVYINVSDVQIGSKKQIKTEDAFFSSGERRLIVDRRDSKTPTSASSFSTQMESETAVA
jgi:transcriptional regulator with XRE-family HTH domain